VLLRIGARNWNRWCDLDLYKFHGLLYQNCGIYSLQIFVNSFDETIMMMSTLYWINTCTLSWICIVLVHWNNSSRTDLSLHSDTPSVFFMYFIFIKFYTRTLLQNVCVVMITTILVNWRLFRHNTQWLSCMKMTEIERLLVHLKLIMF
jgi:hypothetical protein